MKKTVFISLALACGVAHAQVARVNQPAPKAANAASFVAPAPAASGGFSVVDKPYDAPFPIPQAGRVNSAAPAKAPAAKPQVFRIELTDGSLSRALRRWGREANYPVIWEASKDMPAVAGFYTGDFAAAIHQVMEDSGEGAYPLHACFHDNVVRVLHVSQSCSR